MDPDIVGGVPSYSVLVKAMAHQFLPPGFPSSTFDEPAGFSVAADWWEERGETGNAKILRLAMDGA